MAEGSSSSTRSDNDGCDDDVDFEESYKRKYGELEAIVSQGNDILDSIDNNKEKS